MLLNLVILLRAIIRDFSEQKDVVIYVAIVNALSSDRPDPDRNSTDKHIKMTQYSRNGVKLPNICSEFHIWKIRLFCVFAIRFVTDYLQKSSGCRCPLGTKRR